MSVKRVTNIVLTLILLANLAAATKPFLKVVDLANTPKYALESLKDSWNIMIERETYSDGLGPHAFHKVTEEIQSAAKIPNGVKTGVVVVLTKGILFEIAKGVMLSLTEMPGTTDILDPNATYASDDVIVAFTRSHHYAIAILRKRTVVRNIVRFREIMNTIRAQLQGTSTKEGKKTTEKNRAREKSSNSAQKQLPESELEISPPPPPAKIMGQNEETNYAIPLPPGVKTLKINGHPYPVKRVENRYYAIVPKTDVPEYYRLEIAGNCVEIRPAHPGTNNTPNGSCSDNTYATVCAWSLPKDGNTSILIGAASISPRAISYDMYIPKDVAKNTKNIAGEYITILQDPLLRIYLELNKGNVATKAIKITGVSKEFAPRGVVSFGACDVTVADFNVIHLMGKEYKIRFQITDKGTPIYANNVTINIDNRLVIPQRDDEILGYATTVRLSKGEHHAVVSASVPGCGETRYLKVFTTGKGQIVTVVVAVLVAVILAYVLIKITMQNA